MKHSDSIAQLAPALVAAQGEFKAILRDSLNPHFHNKYASLDTIIDSVRPALAKHQLCLVQGASSPVSDDAGRVSAFAVETMLIHASGEWLSNAAILPLAKIDPQGAGGAITYGRRYGIAALLALATEEDDDGNTASGRPASSPTRAAAPAAAPAAEPRASKPAPAPAAPSGAASTACPKCGGDMWDNRVGKRNPRSPDFKCKDKACDGVIWPPKNAPARSRQPAGYADDEPPFPDDNAPDGLPF